MAKNITPKPTLSYVSIGLCPVGNRCAVEIDNTPPTGYIFSPTNDRKYVVHTRFTLLDVAKKTVFPTIIKALHSSSIFPENDEKCFIQHVNPDNKYYTGIPIDKLHVVIELIRDVVWGLTRVYIGTERVSRYIEYVTPVDELRNNVLREQPQLKLVQPGVVILSPKLTTHHAFPARPSVEC